MGIGTLRQYHARPSNLTTAADVLGEVTEKTSFVEATQAAEVLSKETADLAEKIKIKEAEIQKIIGVAKPELPEPPKPPKPEELPVEDVTDKQRFDNESPATKAEQGKVAEAALKKEGFETKTNPSGNKLYKKPSGITTNKNV